MKAGLLAVAAFAAGAVAHPHRRHEHFHEQRDVVVETQWATEIDVVTATAPAAYVYVDQYGNRIDAPTSTPTSAVQHGNWGGDHGHGWSSSSPEASTAPATTTAAPVVTASPTTTPEAYTAPVVSIPVVSVPVISIPAVSVPVISIPVVSSVPVVVASSQAPVASSAPVSNSGLGITYSPYTTGACKDAGQVASDLQALSGYSTIRIYGVDCNQVANVLSAMTSSQKLFVGIFYIDGRLADEISSLRSQVNGRWSQIEAINVGNELVATGTSADTVLAAVSSARSSLADVYSGPVVTIDTVAAYLSNPGLCASGGSATSAVYANCHAFFDPNTAAAGAGDFVTSQIAQIKAKCPGRDVIITESGWPTASKLGMTNGKAIPGTAEQTSAINSLKASFSSNLYIFSAYNELWKPISADTFGVEQSWGILSS